MELLLIVMLVASGFVMILSFLDNDYLHTFVSFLLGLIFSLLLIFSPPNELESNNTEPKQVETVDEASTVFVRNITKEDSFAEDLNIFFDRVSGQELDTNSEEQLNQLEAEDTSITETYVFSEEFEKVIEVISEEKVSEYSDGEKYELLYSIVTEESFNKMKEEEKRWISERYYTVNQLELIRYQSINLERIGDWVWDSLKELMRILIGFGAAFFLIHKALDSRKSGSELIKERLGIEDPTEHKEPEIVLSPLEQKIKDRNEMLIED